MGSPGQDRGQGQHSWKGPQSELLLADNVSLCIDRNLWGNTGAGPGHVKKVFLYLASSVSSSIQLAEPEVSVKSCKLTVVY